MILNQARDHSNEVVCKSCSKLDIYERLGECNPVGTLYKDCDDVYVEGTNKWW